MIRLLPESDLIQTGPVDHADWNYKPLLGLLQRTRFRLINRLLGDEKVDTILEVGYGSGVFMPHLKERCNRLYGIDIHARNEDVEKVLARHGVTASLYAGSAEDLPYESSSIDRIVTVSAIEYVPDIQSACREFKRVLRPGGSVIVVTPGSSPLLDFFLNLLTGEKARDNYDDRRSALRPALLEHFSLQRELAFPPMIGSLIRVYSAMQLVPQGN